MTSWMRVALFFLSLLLVGCANPLELKPVKNQHFTYQAPEKRWEHLNHMYHFRNFGAFSVTIDKHSKIIGFNWYQNGPNLYNIKLGSDQNFYQVVLKNYHGQLTFWRTPTQFIHTKSFRNLMYSELGWYVPFDYMYYWVRGMSLPPKLVKGPVVRKYDQYGHLSSLGENGYVIVYSRYIRQDGFDLPSEIDVYGHHIKIRIAIKEWVLYFHGDLLDIEKTNDVLLKSL